MYGDEYTKIRDAIKLYESAGSVIQSCGDKRQRLAKYAAQKEKMQIAFVGNTGVIDIPDEMQKELHVWLDNRFWKMQSDAARLQESLTCPAATNNRQQCTEEET